MSKSSVATSSVATTVAGTRLAQLLAGMALPGGAPSHRNFVEKLAGLVDLSEAISLSETLRSLRHMKATAGDSGPVRLKEEFLDCRLEMVEFIGRSFASTGKDVPFILPTPRPELLEGSAESFQAYQRFYTLHQSEMDFRIMKLRARVRSQVAAQSPRLARLAELDKALGDTLADNNRRAFAQVPRFLALRFQQLLEGFKSVAVEASGGQPEEWIVPGAWLDRFYREMQNLLLAELEVRLLPVLGLIEAQDTEE